MSNTEETYNSGLDNGFSYIPGGPSPRDTAYPDENSNGGHFKFTGLKGDWDNPFRKEKAPTKAGYSANKDYRRGMSDLRSASSQIGSVGSSMSNMGADLASRFKNVFDPAISKAQQYADVNEQDLVDEAAMGVGSSFDKAQGMQARQLSRYGVSPTSGKFQGATQDMNLMRAAAEAGARNKARIDARNISFGRNMQVAGMGQGLAGQAVGAYGQAANAMSSAANVNNAYTANAWKDAESRGALAGYNKMKPLNKKSAGAAIDNKPTLSAPQGSQFDYNEPTNRGGGGNFNEMTKQQDPDVAFRYNPNQYGSIA